MLEKNNLKKEDLEVLKFLSKYKILKVEDATLIYHTKRYYRDRVNKLISKEYVKRYKTEKGILLKRVLYGITAKK